MSRARLYFTADRARFFLVPPDVVVPAGELVLHTLQGTTDRLDEEALAPHEVDQDAAKAHVDAGWERGVARIRDAWRDLIGAAPTAEPPDLSRWPGGVSPGAIATDPERQREARRNLIEGAQRLFGVKDEERVTRTEERLDRLGEQAADGAKRVRTAAEELGQDLAKRAPDVEKTFEEVGRGLSDLAGSMVASLRGQARRATTEEEGDEGEEEP
ncbi:MAG: hypothetical protein H6738_03780 [Alphaproteobacteria bacterium]|nr:hypothetical protein [Alphaproteobacteria bacterium]MCB9695889.1 hypothetical protein [Alphaproteobacteria bacterium]